VGNGNAGEARVAVSRGVGNGNTGEARVAVSRGVGNGNTGEAKVAVSRGVGNGNAGEARVAVSRGVGNGNAGEATVTAVKSGVCESVTGEAAAKAVETVARIVARTERDFSVIKDMVALLPWVESF
jgi:hypothetical protein